MKLGNNRFIKKSLVMGVASALSISMSSALYAADSMTVDIKKQPIDAALFKLAEKSGVQIVLDQKISKSIQLSPIQGKYTVNEALDALLEGTGLSYEFTSEDLVLIKEEESNDEGSVEGDVDEEVVVTGTRLKGYTASGSNTVVISRDDIKRQGFNNMEDVLRSLPQNLNFTNSASGQDSTISGAQGQVAANLRGLGTDGTLVLVNGRRWLGSSSFSFTAGTVNLNGIPFSAVERVEVLLDGASAVYGADALGGVINIITRDEYQGGETIARYDTNRNGGGTWQITQHANVGWDSGQASLNLSYSETDGVKLGKLFNTLDFSSLGGTDQRTRSFGQPGVVFGRGALPVRDDGTSGLSGLSADNVVPYDRAASGGFASVTPDSESLNVHLTAEQELTDSIKLFGEILHANNKSQAIAGVPFFSFGFVTSDNRFNDTGGSLFVSYIFEQELLSGQLPTPTSDSEQDNLTYTFGFEADLPFADWTMDFSATFAEEDSDSRVLQLDRALLGARLAGATETEAEHLNPFGNGTAQDPAALAGLLATSRTFTTSEQDNYLLTAQGSAFELPAGTVSVLVGTEFRKESLDFSGSPGSLFQTLPAPERDVESYFMEVAVPLVSEQNSIPGVESLGLKVALRSDEYSFSGPFDPSDRSIISERQFDNTSPKIDLSWQVISSLKLRASWGESFRAPSISDLFSDGFTQTNRFISFIDPAHPELGVQRPPFFTFTSNPDVGPEKSDNISYGFDWIPEGALEGLSLSATYSDLNLNDAIGQAGFFDTDLLVTIPGALVPFDDSDLIEEIRFFPINIARQSSRVVDVNLGYDLDTDVGSFQFALGGSYTKERTQQSGPEAAPVELHGTINGPERVRARGSIGWFQDNTSINLGVNYSSGYDNRLFSFADPQRVEHYITYDLTGSYTFEELGWKVSAGALNVFNQSFPFANRPERPYDSRRVDTRGRVVYLEVSKSYDIF